MAIRLREVEGKLVALCAAEVDPKEGDIYLDDNAHYALACKFAREHTVDWEDAEMNRLMDSQKVRDAKKVLIDWLQTQGGPPRVAKVGARPPGVEMNSGR